MASIEIPEWISESTVERAYRMALKAQGLNDNRFAQKGMRAARARDGKLLLALEGSAEVLQKMQERQHGRTQRDASTPFSHKVDLTEFALWREAYKLCDEGRPTLHFCWIYGAAAVLAGL